jgi:hypothetical protein
MCYLVIVGDVWSQCYSYWTEVVRCHYRGWWFRSKKVLVSSTLWSSPMPHVFAFGIWWNKKHHGWWQVRVSIRWGSRVKANVNDGCIRAVVPPMWPPIWRGLFSVYILGGSSTNPKWIISYIYILSLVLSGISTVNSLTTGVITYLLSGNHQVTTVIIIPRPWRSHDIPHESPR